MASNAGTKKLISGLTTAIRNRPFVVLGAAGVVGVTGYKQYKAEKRLAEDAKKKRVLVLPFHRMKIVEEKKSPASALFSNLTGSVENGGVGTEKTIEMQSDELITLIKEAAEDPSIVSMYGVFGNGGTISTGGWAHLEEIRNALETFSKPSSTVDEDDESARTNETKKTGKAMHAYSNTFGGQKSMQEYYLASAFHKIHLQPQGDLNLYGLHTTNLFIRDFLKKYGITVHVWKHGVYKNMANLFTHSYYSKEHLENAEGVLLPIHKHVCNAIYSSRHEQLKKYGYDFDQFWSMVENAGSLPANVAHQIGFVDHLPLKNPLDALLKNNKREMRVRKEGVGGVDTDVDASSIMTDTTSPPSTSGDSDDDSATEKVDTKREKENTAVAKSGDENSSSAAVGDNWKLGTDSGSFQADSQIFIDAYSRQRSKLRKKRASSGNLLESLLSAFGIGDEDEKSKEVKEKIAVIKINGAIGEMTARKAEKALRKVKEQKDIKCVVLRVDSPGGSINACESIHQEILDLPQKVIVSFGNVSASGGYYISSSAERIFALPSTVTGSIGVVMMRMNFKDLAKQYGITFDSIPTSDLSGSNDPFYPVNKKMNENFGNQADRSYHRFKSLVSSGRNMSMKDVEKVAKGRVFTGEQAKKVGLVDELGGLDEAIDYAQQNCTSSGAARVVNWPPKKSFWQFLSMLGSDEEGANNMDEYDVPDVVHVALSRFVNLNNSWTPSSRNIELGGIYSIFGNGCFACPSLPVTSGVMLTVDENAAIQCMLEDANVLKGGFASHDGTNNGM
ncbi:unnamed protein product [Pseudo-nitzschia multistriata]|uniref:Peptidase S49 domain-containing protein n=1 Tax=Pseudo-nitzschia multistriata TaxID=183589 RepID=A0A448YYM4_9STRA|nr:unnamed protein product [Pseudo-nitzschia multistriata]